MLKILARNMVSNWIGFAVQVGVVFFLTPFVLHAIGDVRYGIWALATGLTGYYGLLDLGFRSGIMQYMTRHLAKGDYVQLNRTASTGFHCAGLLWRVCCRCLLHFELDCTACFLHPERRHRRGPLVHCRGGVLGSVDHFLFYPFSAVFTATQRYDLSNAIGVSTRVASALITYGALKEGYGLVAISVISAAGDFVGISSPMESGPPDSPPIGHLCSPCHMGKLVAGNDFWDLEHFDHGCRPTHVLHQYCANRVVHICGGSCAF